MRKSLYGLFYSAVQLHFTIDHQKTKFYSSDAPSPNKPELIIEYTRKYAFSIGVNHGTTGTLTGDFTGNVDYADSCYDTISTITSGYKNYTPTYQYMRGNNFNGDRMLGSYVLFLNGHGCYNNLKFNHGNNDGDYATGVYYGYDLDSSTGYKYAGIQSTDMSGVDLISFVGCSTSEGTANLCSRAITAGATSVVGFFDTINSRNTDGPEWLEVYNDELASGATIEDAIDAATEDYPDSNLGDYYELHGSSSNTIAPLSSSKGTNTNSRIDKYECNIPFDFSKHTERVSFPLNTAKGFEKMINKIKEIDPSFDGEGYYVWINTNAGNKSGSIKIAYYVENEIQTNKTYLFSVRTGMVTKLLSLDRPLPASKSELEQTLVQKVNDFKASYQTRENRHVKRCGNKGKISL